MTVVRFRPLIVYFQIVRVSRTCRVLTAKPFSARASERVKAKE